MKSETIEIDSKKKNIHDLIATALSMTHKTTILIDGNPDGILTVEILDEEKNLKALRQEFTENLEKTCSETVLSKKTKETIDSLTAWSTIIR